MERSSRSSSHSSALSSSGPCISNGLPSSRLRGPVLRLVALRSRLNSTVRFNSRMRSDPVEMIHEMSDRVMTYSHELVQLAQHGAQLFLLGRALKRRARQVACLMVVG